MADPASPLIELCGISRHFVSGSQTVAVLKNISLSIQQGEMVAIIGASGSGKSTLMNIIGCLDKPTQGEMQIKGISTQLASSEQLAQLRSQYIGFIFQRYHLMPYLSAAENVAIPALYTAMPAADRQVRAEYLLTQLGLQQRMEYKPAQLSGGQQQRVSIARALMNGAEIILADEPTGALDRASGQELMGILHSLHRSGHTIIIVTHDRDVANQAQRIIEISDGEIIADRLNEAVAPLETRPALPVAAATGRTQFWQSVKEAVKMAWRALLGHRARAFLSMLGIIIGISSVVSSMAVGEGARQSILNEISQLGTSTLEIRPGLGWDQPRPDFARSLKISDVDLLAQQPYVDSVSPVVSKTINAVRGGKQGMVSISGISNAYFRVQGLHFLSGNGFTQRDVDEREPVVIIDPELRSTLFEQDEVPEGEIIQLAGTPYRVIGIAERKGGKFSGMMLGAWMPYTSLLERMSGNMPIESITLRVHDGVSLHEAQGRVEQLLEQAHGQRDFFTQTNDQMTQAIRKASDSMSLLITAIAGISLLVGGVGVMNIMLVSVTERTHEIGIRLSVGARPADIMRQFLIEAMVICSLGGLIGIIGSGLAGVIFSWVTQEFTMVFTWPPIVLACGFSALIGLGFGFSLRATRRAFTLRRRWRASNDEKCSLTMLLPLLLSGCGSLVKSDYQQPMLSVPTEWRVQDTGSGYLQQGEHWWDSFDDPQLSTLIGRALTSNNDLAIAGLQLQQARLAAGLTNTNLTPGVTVGGSASNSKKLRNDTASTESYSTSLDLSYELDLWGKLARAREQAQWQVDATEQDRQNTALMLIGNTAQYYWQVANLNQQITQQKAGLEIGKQTFQMVQSRYAAGAAGQLDLLQAQQSLIDRENQYRTLQQQREEARNALAILFNRSPTDRQAERTSLDINQDVPIAKTLPVEVIARRPDVKAAEGRLRAALAGSDVERLSFYPTLSLSASLGAASSIFSQWFSNPARTLGASAALPFVQWNTVQLTIEKSDLDVKQAAITFRSKVYSALSDVDNAMTQRLSYQQQRKNQQQNLQLSQQRLALAKSQYQAGAVSFQTLLDAEDSLLNVETNLSNLQYKYLNSTMKLWLALGGGVEKENDKEG